MTGKVKQKELKHILHRTSRLFWNVIYTDIKIAKYRKGFDRTNDIKYHLDKLYHIVHK